MLNLLQKWRRLGGEGDRGPNSWDCQARVLGQNLLDGFSSHKFL